MRASSSAAVEPATQIRVPDERPAQTRLRLGRRPSDVASVRCATTARYPACLASLAPLSISRALAAIARADRESYADAVADVLKTFETRARFLEDVPVADTVLVLRVATLPRSIDVELRSLRSPSDS